MGAVAVKTLARRFMVEHVAPQSVTVAGSGAAALASNDARLSRDLEIEGHLRQCYTTVRPQIFG